MKFPATGPLLTDLYQFTMIQAYLDAGMVEEAVFEFFVRKLPQGRNFLIAAGLEQVLRYLESLVFSPQELEWLERAGGFNRRFIDYLAELRFAGEVHAMPEGTAFFPNEPILRVTAPIPVAQLVESRIINLLNFETLIASKAARCVLAAPGKFLVDFGLRRAHGAEAGLLASRASYLAGFSGTSAVLAGAELDIPVFGTMAHSFIQAHATEREAFAHFAAARPRNVTFLIDTYDTEAAAQKVVDLAPALLAQGVSIRSVRLDSGDLAAHAFKVRRILDAGGLARVGIFCSGGLDEYALRDLLSGGAPIDGFGVGTALDVSADSPCLDAAYKLQEYAGQARRKRSEGKATWPGRKQVYRRFAGDGTIAGDMLTLESDPQEGAPLIVPVMRGGQRLAQESLARLRARAAAELARLPQELRRLEDCATPYPVEVSRSLRELAEELDRQPH
ncbi:MAG: nicotinate phosphoribosyltransferase [Betaproteobacteria bacterium]|nr:nicotinate phosphoribosyltransferase [Betaproteobacteria bacterium]